MPFGATRGTIWRGGLEVSMEKASYGRFLAMVGTGTAVMFVVMYLNTWAFEHALWSWTRFYMAMMAVVMLLFMLPMYKDRRANAAIFAGSAALFVAGLVLVRTQVLVGDVAWMRAMVPHHSIAILTSERAGLEDERVRALASEIIETQRREIAEMKMLIADLE